MSSRGERGSGLKADVYLVGDDELHAWVFSRAHRYRIGDLAVHVAPPEHVIVRKLAFYREGGSARPLRAEVELLTRYLESQGKGIRPRFRAAARLGPTWVLRVPGRLAARMPL